MKHIKHAGHVSPNQAIWHSTTVPVTSAHQLTYGSISSAHPLTSLFTSAHQLTSLFTNAHQLTYGSISSAHPVPYSFISTHQLNLCILALIA